MDINKKNKIINSIAFIILVFIISIVIAIVIRYQVDGEINMPFELKKITIISTAEGQSLETNEEFSRWNEQINQSNDIYFFIDKNNNYNKQAVIESVKIENISTETKPVKGTIKAYMPSSNEGRTFEYDDRFCIQDSLTYNGAKISNEKALEICNQGGRCAIRIANVNLGTYESNDAEEIKHDGTLISKANIANSEIYFSIKFDFIIVINKIKYKTNITLELPNGNIIEEGTSQIEITDLKNIVFKRIS